MWGGAGKGSRFTVECEGWALKESMMDVWYVCANNFQLTGLAGGRMWRSRFSLGRSTRAYFRDSALSGPFRRGILLHVHTPTHSQKGLEV